MKSAVAPVRCALVMEKTLGHVTGAQHLREVVAGQRDVDLVWLPIPFETRGLSRLRPLFNSNWSVRASWRARRALHGATAAAPLDAILFHIRSPSLFLSGMMRRLPSANSLDSTTLYDDSAGAHYGHRPSNDGFSNRKRLGMNQLAFRVATTHIWWSEWAQRSRGDDYGFDPTFVRMSDVRRHLRLAGRALGHEKFDARRNSRAVPDILIEAAHGARQKGSAA